MRFGATALVRPRLLGPPLPARAPPAIGRRALHRAIPAMLGVAIPMTTTPPILMTTITMAAATHRLASVGRTTIGVIDARCVAETVSAARIGSASEIEAPA